MSKVMITGATGLLGRALCQELSSTHEILGCGFSRAAAPLHKLDLADHSSVLDFLDNHGPEILIHAAAERRPEQCERDQAATLALNRPSVSASWNFFKNQPKFKVQVHAARQIAHACSNANASLSRTMQIGNGELYFQN